MRFSLKKFVVSTGAIVLLSGAVAPGVSVAAASGTPGLKNLILSKILNMMPIHLQMQNFSKRLEIWGMTSKNQ